MPVHEVKCEPLYMKESNGTVIHRRDPLLASLKKLCFHPLTFPFIIFVIFLYKHLYKNPARRRKVSVSPPKLPILGNLHQLGRLPHRSLHSLCKQYGELMLFYIGKNPSLVVSSANIARQIFKTHDIIFSNRPVSHIISRIIYEGKSLVFSPYGEYWRWIRSLFVLKLLSNKKVQSFRKVRKKEVNLQLLKEFVEVVGDFSIKETIPWLGWVDLSGLESQVEKVVKDFDEFLKHVVLEHLDSKIKKEENEKDFVHILIDVQQENPTALSMDNIKAIVLVRNSY
ncbi:Cytochrome P450 71A21 [Bienertia sinuspersici]